MTVFGLQWTQATDAYVRPAESVLTHKAVTSPTNAETVAAAAQASTYAPWSSMRRCNLWDDGTVTAYYGDRCYTDTDVANMGQAMVRIPKFWYTTNHGGGVYIWYISDTGSDALPAGADHAWAVHPAFIRDGVTKNYIYLGAYEAYKNGTKLESVSGQTPTVSQTLAQFRTAAHARAAGAVANKWEVQDYLSTSAVQLLYLIEYGNFSSQLISIGHGVSGGAAAHNTGESIAYGNTSFGSAAVTTTVMSYRGIENLYGNLNKVIDGINIKGDNDPWIADHDFAVDTFAHPYVNSTATPILNATGYVTDIKVDATFDYGFLPSTGGGTESTKLCDSYTTDTGNRSVMYGGRYSYGGIVGAFMFYTSLASASTSSTTITTRLMYIG